jgi:RNA polymerase sigma-70 factor, ECF subfamily
VRIGSELAAGSFEHLAMPHFERLYNFACWLTHDRQEAEDVVRETYVKALKGFSSFEPGTNFRAWIYKILRNAFLNSRTGLRAMATVQFDLEDEEEVLPAVRDTPESILLQRSDGQLVQQALEQLPVAYREVLLLCEVEDWTPTTPTVVLAPAIFFQDFSLSLAIIAAANIATASAPLPDINDISTTYFFVRRLGNIFGVTAATIMFDHRMTFHSSRLLDIANRLDPTVRSTLAQYASLIHRNGGGGSDPVLGALQLFQANVIMQSRLLSYIDIDFGLAMLAVFGLISLAVSQIKPKLGPTRFHPW